MLTRLVVTKEDLGDGLHVLVEALNDRMNKHGDGAFVGPHEGLGVAAEEYHELVDAVRSNDKAKVEKENIDLAVACLFAVISQRASARAAGAGS